MLEQGIISWNKQWEFDYWYREKFGIAFNSPEHRKLTPIDIKLTFIEEKLMVRGRGKYLSREKDKEVYERTGRWLKVIKGSKKEEDKLFDLVDFKDLADYDTKED
jgi:hypothetical protein